MQIRQSTVLLLQELHSDFCNFGYIWDAYWATLDMASVLAAYNFSLGLIPKM